MIVKNKLLLGFFRTGGGKLASALFVLLLFTGDVRAQTPECPTSVLPTGCSWGNSNGAFPITIPGTSCTVQIQFCYVCCSGTNYFYISAMIPQSSACDDVDPQLIENAADAWLFSAAALNGQCPIGPCPATTEVSVMTPSCWVKNGVSGAYTFDACGTGSCYCQLTAQVCISQPGNVVHISGGTSTLIGMTCTCASDPGISTLWVTGTCYQLACPPAP
jgi:hypothetical protein